MAIRDYLFDILKPKKWNIIYTNKRGFMIFPNSYNSKKIIVIYQQKKKVCAAVIVLQSGSLAQNFIESL